MMGNHECPQFLEHYSISRNVVAIVDPCANKTSVRRHRIITGDYDIIFSPNFFEQLKKIILADWFSVGQMD
jgi:hypothetical protein